MSARRLVVLASLLLALSGPRLALASEPQATSGARIAVEPRTFDFGRVLPRRTLRKEFRLRNAGHERLVLKRVSTSCGCTAAAPATTTLEPGASTPLKVEFHTPTSPGRVRKRVLVSSNDPTTPLLEITIEATIETKAER